jgi:hypothetical protein
MVMTAFQNVSWDRMLIACSSPSGLIVIDVVMDVKISLKQLGHKIA